jgi:hypothetical protein
MEANKTSLMQGSTILARLGKLEKRLSPAWSRAGSVFLGMAVFCGVSCVGLTLGALMRREWTYLGWMLGGIGCWALSSVLYSLFHRSDTNGKELQESDDRVIARVDQLRADTKSGQYGAVPSGKINSLVWISDRGVYTTTGMLPRRQDKLTAWEYYSGYTLESPESSLHQVVLWRAAKTGMAIRVITTQALLLWIAGLVCIFYGGWIGLHHIGLRDDVLVCFSMGLAFIGVIGCLTHSFAKNARFSRDRQHRAQDVLMVNASEVSRSEITSLLNEHLKVIE